MLHGGVPMDTTLESGLSLPQLETGESRSRRKLKLKKATLVAGISLTVALAFALNWFQTRYATSDIMDVKLTEYTNTQYPEDPADRSQDFGRYANRTLQLIKRDDTHFDFVLKPTNSHTATITFKNVDVSLFVTSEPLWTKANPDLETIALTDREWNRQQVSFSRESGHVEVSGGNGFEASNLYSAEIAKNCLNAGLWEILLFTNEGGKKLYYQSWFTFPLGHYKNVFEKNTGISYWLKWIRLEHWVNPQGALMDLNGLREVKSEREVQARFLQDEPIFAFGEQKRKQRTLIASNLLTWKDFYQGKQIHFATFAPPGRYEVNKPWKNEYWRLAKFKKVYVRDVISAANKSKTLKELELVFEDEKTGQPTRVFVSGFDVNTLPQLKVEDYPKGLYMPMGIGVPPFFQKYEDLEKNPPYQSPYFSMVLDGESRWINHHDMAVDGPVIHRDSNDPNLLHVYLLSYERHSLIAHFLVPLT